MLNVEKKNLDRALQVLPALNAPTVSMLSDDTWAAVNTVLDSSLVRSIIPALKAAGAVGIVEYALNKVVL
jgi:ATP phosphoribosyltransferase